MSTYPGGKSGSGVYHRLAREIPPHDVRIVPFLGRCAITRKVRPAEETHGIELDPDVLAQWTPEETAAARVQLHQGCGIEWLREWFQLRGRRITRPELIPQEAFAALYRGSECGRPLPFVFCDPPYPLETLSSDCPYPHALTDGQHLDLLQILKRIPALVMIVSYPNELYDRELAGWRTFRYRAFTRRGERTEQAWTNYPRPRVLHDWRFIGENRRERERIRRSIDNCVSKFAERPPAERAAILYELLAVQAQAAPEELPYTGVCTRCLTTFPRDVTRCPVCSWRKAAAS